MYVHMLFCSVEAIINWHGWHDLVACFVILARNYSMISLFYCPTKWRLSAAHVGKMKPFKFLCVTTPQVTNCLYYLWHQWLSITSQLQVISTPAAIDLSLNYMQQCFITSYALRASTLQLVAPWNSTSAGCPSGVSGKGYYCAQQLHLGNGRLRI